MATKVIPVQVCDVCGQPADGGPLRFGWDLINYEIDLCPQHRESIAASMEGMVKAARRLGAPPTSVEVPRPPRTVHDQVSTPQVRAWALANKVPGVSDRGRIPAKVVQAYLDAQDSK